MKRLRLLLPLLMILFSLLLEVASAKRGGTWTETSPMTVVRQFQTATLLRDDNVLVAAGYGDGGRLASAELYDPARHAWTATGSLNAGRGFHTAALLLDGQVLVAGGFNSNHDSFGIASAELYDPARHTWTLVDPMNNARVHHTATLLPTGQVLVAGGNNYFPIASTELYDPIHHTWTFATSMNVIRTKQTATLLRDGTVLVAGGSGIIGNGGPLASAEIYDPVRDNWILTGSLNAARVGHTATLLKNGKVLVAGGFDSAGNPLASAEIYDPEHHTWTLTDPLNVARGSHTATLLSGGRVLVAGGGFDIQGNAFTSAEIFSPGHRAWTVTNPMNDARVDHTATLLPTGQVLVAGGFNGVLSQASAEIFSQGEDEDD